MKSTSRLMVRVALLSLAPVDWFRFGLATQRILAHWSARKIQRGFLVGLSYKKAESTAYMFNPDESRPTFVFALGVSF
jgi:hypothetical protein